MLGLNDDARRRKKAINCLFDNYDSRLIGGVELNYEGVVKSFPPEYVDEVERWYGVSIVGKGN